MSDPRPKVPAPVRARRFVESHGEARDRAVAAVMVGAAQPEQVAQAVAGEVGEPLARLHALLFVGLGAHPQSEALVAELERTQRDDGSFAGRQEGPDAEDELAERISYTGEVAGVLARTPYARRSTLDRAAAFMGAHWSVERVQGPTYEPILAYFELLASHPTDLADEALQWCGRELERGFRTGVFDAARVARVFVRCAARALPGTPLGVDELAPSLVAAQAEDGGFGPTDAPAGDRVAATIDALVVWSGGQD